MTVRILIGDVREKLREMEPESVDCVVTSPPYWGLRDYGTASWIGGDPDCDHRPGSMKADRNEDRPKLAGSAATNSAQLLHMARVPCGKCGAVRVDRQIGLEPTVTDHVAAMVDVFRELRRVVKPNAAIWVNYGDCYATSPNGRSAADTKAAGNDDRTFRDKPFSTVGGALKAKDLCLVPFRFAIAAQEDGWWVRSRCIWGKPNGMPDSSGRYRPSVAHEEIFLLSKSGDLYYDSEAVKKPCDQSDWKQPDNWDTGAGGHGSFHRLGREKGKRPDKQRGHSRRHAGSNDRWDGMTKDEQQENGRLLRTYEPEVWHIATAAYSDAHFATFPPALVERCLTASCPKGGTVLDPFGGAGTTGLVADRMGFDAVLIELNPEYAALAERRIENDAPMFAKVAVA